MDPSTILLAILFFLTSIIFAMAGLGGASAYLAIMVLFNLPYQSIPAMALACNVVVTIAVVYKFYRAGHFNLHLVLPFLITSIPAAYIGGQITVPEIEFKVILIIVLAVVTLRIFFWNPNTKPVKKPSLLIGYTVGPFIGILLGLMAGIVGIGGGVFLLPTILFLRWGKAREAAAAAGLFTFVNSISGLVSHGIRGITEWHLLAILMVAVFAGGLIGSHLGAKKLPTQVIQKVFALLLLVVVIRLIVSII